MSRQKLINASDITPTPAKRIFWIDNESAAYYAVTDEFPELADNESREDEVEQKTDEWLKTTWANLNESQLKDLDDQVEQSRYLQWRNHRRNGELIENMQSLIRKKFEEILAKSGSFESNMLFDVKIWKKYLFESGLSGYFVESCGEFRKNEEFRGNELLPPFHKEFGVFAKTCFLNAETYF